MSIGQYLWASIRYRSDFKRLMAFRRIRKENIAKSRVTKFLEKARPGWVKIGLPVAKGVTKLVGQKLREERPGKFFVKRVFAGAAAIGGGAAIGKALGESKDSISQRVDALERKEKTFKEPRKTVLDQEKQKIGKMERDLNDTTAKLKSAETKMNSIAHKAADTARKTEDTEKNLSELTTKTNTDYQTFDERLDQGGL